MGQKNKTRFGVVFKIPGILKAYWERTTFDSPDAIIAEKIEKPKKRIKKNQTKTKARIANTLKRLPKRRTSVRDKKTSRKT